MDFKLSQIAVPFRMQPGLRRLADDELQLTPLQPGSRLYQEKQAAVESGKSRQHLAGFDPTPALRAIAARGHGDPTTPELAYEEDFAVLDGETGRLPWLCVCVPSHWAPEEKLGLDFAALHAPVADSATIVAASQHLVALATGGQCWERFVWTLTPSPRYDQHPMRHSRTPWPALLDDGGFAAACWLRAERQCFFPVGQGTRQSVFTIRVMLQPLVEAVASREDAGRLRDSLASMSDAVLDYKGLRGARAPLLRWLDSRAD
ncbi:heme-dependent oxidative N-demethylase subunit alpha family protein [Caenimonas sp. SL110]|uniref:heme-dependent oxidative N-demethylase subunit alpha family protein n=1 Tax=Caenimonas sp. SL110 TaxID=1450524 RepID=UPI000B20F434|nr:heme-dependent oxidative N-demethylase subunit alpha family protein [Caenimonas sp. SL110]